MLNLTIREQLLIVLMFLLLFMLAGIWGVKYLNRQEKYLQQQLSEREKQIKHVRNPVSYTHLTLPTIYSV